MVEPCSGKAVVTNVKLYKAQFSSDFTLVIRVGLSGLQ